MFKTYIITDDVGLEIVSRVLGDKSEVKFIPSPTENEIIKNCSDAEALISIYEPVTAKVIDALPNLKFISVASIGFNMVDIRHAKEKNVLVSNNPNYCIEEVADHAAALILTISRKIVEYNKSVKVDKVWKYEAVGEKINRLRTRKLGLVGFGSISKKLAHRMQAFGCEVIAYDPFVSQESATLSGVKLTSIEELLEQSDIISIHMPLNPHTRLFFNEEKFNAMKRKPIFINCARGEIVDEDALLEALDNGLISYAGLDVLSSENPVLENCSFVNRENVILTPHAAFYSQEAMEDAQVFAAKHIVHYLENNLDKIPLVVDNKSSII